MKNQTRPLSPFAHLTIELRSGDQKLGTIQLSPNWRKRLGAFAEANETDLAGVIRLALCFAITPSEHGEGGNLFNMDGSTGELVAPDEDEILFPLR